MKGRDPNQGQPGQDNGVVRWGQWQRSEGGEQWGGQSAEGGGWWGRSVRAVRGQGRPGEDNGRGVKAASNGGGVGWTKRCGRWGR